MFTGIVEHIGTVEEFKELDTSESGGNGVSLLIKDATSILGDCHIGDSISINGTCLTVTEFDENTFKVGLAPETLRRTNLGSLKSGSKVNLERAIGGDVRFGGHYVQGHVDTVASIEKIDKDGNALNFTFKLKDLQYINYIVEKGFIAIDGTSLTITHVDHKQGTFGISMIEHTQKNVIMTLKHIDDFVNIEVDLTGKLIEKQVELQLSSQISNEESPLVSLIHKIVEEKLSKITK
ncbi:Riboflavin synthase alpha chain [Wickerhamomyces ciferrii]|uniref:Riboflavin synthase n=1 Tax=Wickerhamomyces ciferrii (strain ATCC 14091 / BCRC 22168 / CBS 111 / JCM 3599 / NBRC 0793 / NRRL Y-1031 F-60-10) TaxID=1206466 RepID=K0K752_WICCF|nr:Riboflavin synthase alpha chain [Wickerhamomyces ciferrii]CCH40690.1 Riboflavin synthase alpha chain [Wickerhamomyces ciferrii]